MRADLTIITWVVVATFLVDWLAVGYSWRKVEIIAKPSAMIAVILWTLSLTGWPINFLIAVLVLGQVFGLAGDVFLLLSPRWFLLGLVSFLVGHVFYIVAAGYCLFAGNSIDGFARNITWGSLLAVVVWVLMLISFYGFVAPKSPRMTMPRSLWISIQVYGWILSVMVLLCVLVYFSASQRTGQLVFLPIGAFLFYVSDSMLAYDRFKKKMPKIRLWIMISYHLAQFSLAVGFLAGFGIA